MARALRVTYLCGALLFIVFNTTALGAGPCKCDEIDKLQKHLDRVANAEEAWKEIFAWAREAYRDVDLPQSNDDLNQKFFQLTSAPKSQWYDLIKQGPVKEKKAIKKVAGVSPEGEPVVDDDFKKNNCDDIIEAEHVHERAHKDFYLSFPKVFEVPTSSRLLQLRSESEVESYRTHKSFLEKKLAELKVKCITNLAKKPTELSVTKLDASAIQALEQTGAQRQRMNEAEIRVRLLGSAPVSLSPVTATTLSPTTETVKKYLAGCRNKPTKATECEKLRKDAVEILQEDLRTLGSSVDRSYRLSIMPVFQSEEVELRIAAADAIGMIGPQDRDTEFLAPVANDPVPNVRKAVGQAIAHGKGPALVLLGGRLGSRTMAVDSGAAPDPLPDPGKLPIPVLSQSTYVYFSSDPVAGRVSYLTKGMNETAAFYKGKAKKGPFTNYEFQEKYKYQLADEDRAKYKDVDAESAKQNETVKPDPTNMQAMMGQMQRQGERARALQDDMYLPPMFEKPTVYVLEERQIGSRIYPTRYVVLYEDVAFKRPGYRLSWMTISDNAIKTAQAETLKDEQQEAAENKRQEAVDNLIQKKDAAEKKQFKKGQADLEKELGF